MSRRPRSTRRRYLTVGLAVIALAVAAALAWVGVRGMLAKTELEAALTDASQLSAALDDGDLRAAREAAAAFGDHAGAAAQLTADPVWRAAELVPFAGPNLRAVRVAASASHSVMAEAVDPLLVTADGLLTASPSGSLVDVAALREARPTVDRARDVIRTADDDVASVDRSSLIPVLSAAVGSLGDRMRQADALAGALADATAIVPGMLGSDGPRTILVMLQNNAELRTGGGITGTFIELRATDGALEIVRQADSSDFPVRRSPILPLPDALTTLYGDAAGRFVQNTSMTPDFDLTARLASAWWEEEFSVTPDAVVSVDPLVLKAVLRAIGPVPTPEGPLESGNLVQRLLIDPYQSLSDDEQTTVFEHATAAVFDALTGDLDPLSLGRALAGPIGEGRVSIWSRHADEQAVLGASDFAGPLARQDATVDAYAAYLNDATGGKMDAFLDVGLGIGSAGCREDDRADVLVTVTLESTAPKDAATRLPESVTGGGAWGTPPGITSTIVSVSAPQGGFAGAVEVDGVPVGATLADDGGRPVTSTRVDLEPGGSATLTFRFTSPAPGEVAPRLLHTPLISDPDVAAVAPACG